METYNDYKYIHFCLAPSGMYVGWTVYENGYYFGSGKTIDACTLNVKQTVYFKKKVSTRGYTIAPKPSTRDEVPVEKMHPIFKGRAWFGHNTKSKLTREQIEFVQSRPCPNTKKPEIPVEKPQTPEYDYYDYKMEDGVLTVFGCKKIADYPIKVPFDTKTQERNTLHLPLGD